MTRFSYNVGGQIMKTYGRRTLALALLATVLMTAMTLVPSIRAQGSVQSVVDGAFAKYRNLQEGKNADYIPALAKVDPNLFGIAMVTADGKIVTAGDVKTEVSIQSISKVFTMARVIQDQGPDAIEEQIGVDATGMGLNSIVSGGFAEKEA